MKNDMDIRELYRPNIRSLAPYSTARDEYRGELGIFLDANENPYDNGCNRYPDPRQRELKLHNAVSIAPTYGMYKVAAAINDVPMREVPLEPDFSLDERKLLAATDGDTRLLLLCSPNNPTGNCFPRAQIERIVRTFPGIVVLDEAYIDFADTPGLLGELDRFPNLIILQTLSKAWGMAGLRLGLAFAQEEIVETLSRVKYPYNINVITQRAVLERLETSIDGQVAEIVSERERVAEALRTLPAVRKIYPSQANFLLARFDDPRGVYERLIGEGIIVRDRSRVAGCEGCLRITIGTPAQNDRLIETLKNETA